MRWLVDLVALVACLLTAPWWLWRLARTGKLRSDWSGRLGAAPHLPAGTPGRRLLLHAVSVGEVNAIRTLVGELAAEGVEVVVAATTNTGFARARTLFGNDLPVVRYPLDFNFAARRFLDRVRPDAIGLVELEVWPAFTAACARRGIPLGVINGRLSERSARRYARVRALVRPSFSRLAFAAVQTEAYAERFRALGAAAERVVVTGTMKWDTAEITDTVAGADELANALGLDRSRPLVVAGSTAPEEHALLDGAVPEGVQLLCAPRKPEWFDQASRDLPGCARRSRGDVGSDRDRYLLDTIGELRRAYALADLCVVGRSFGSLHGSDMMEPIALGRATVVGPATGDFQATVDALLAGDGLVQIPATELGATIASLLADPDRRAALAANGRAVIEREQGATARHARLLIELLAPDR
ncbi:MAG: glycosyltransferase [Planctomycetes bacterium]|nr:glycosyltransferase [Planctomycetota bacterium]